MRRLGYIMLLMGGIVWWGGCRRPGQPELAPPKLEKPQPPVQGERPNIGKQQPRQKLPEVPRPPSVPGVKPEELPSTQVGPGKVPESKPSPPTQPPSERAGVKTRIVRALLEALDRVEGVEKDQKDGVAKSLLQADEELSRVLGGNAKRLILEANKKPPLLIVEEPTRRPILTESEQPGSSPESLGSALSPPSSPASPSAKHPAVQALLKTLDNLSDQDPAVKEQLRKTLLETDQKLRP